MGQCRQENGPICEPPIETKLMARACCYYHPGIYNEFDMQKSRIPLWRIKSWNFRSVPNVIVYILENSVNLYDSNGDIAVLISALGDKKWNLPFSVYLLFPQNPLNILGHIIRRCKYIFKENTMPFESWETVQN